MVNIRKATKTEDLKEIECLAEQIWKAHYTAIIGKPQVDYMLKHFQSLEAMLQQIEVGFVYFIVAYNSKDVGYISIKEEPKTLFLSKLYISSDFRGKKMGSSALKFIQKEAKDRHLERIRLTVNKNNIDSIKIYEKLGFVKKGNIVIDIGNGFVMDDFEMVKYI